MRKALKKVNDKRMSFTGVVERFGTKKNWHGYPEKTLLVKDLKFTETGNFATDHIWFTVGKTIDSLNLEIGDIITFEARVGSYTKGYVNYREWIDERTIDYKLNRPTKFKITKKHEDSIC